MPLQNSNTNTVPTFKNAIGQGEFSGEINYRIEIENLTSAAVEVGGFLFYSNNIVNVNVPVQLINPPNILPNVVFLIQNGIVHGVLNNNFGIQPQGSGWEIPGNSTVQVLNVTTTGPLTLYNFMGDNMSTVDDTNGQDHPCSTALNGALIENIPNAEFKANYITI